jgi:hypothetical protein
MIKYAKITNQETGLCEVGLGTNTSFYQSIGMKQLDVQQSDLDGNWYLASMCPMKSDEEKEQEEKERIAKLYMTRSDFFDGTIKALGLDNEDLLMVIQLVLNNIDIDNISKKVAINNFKNALNFYRSHPLFDMISDIPLPISEDKTIVITKTQWDEFFRRTDDKEEDAYMSLIPIELPPEE